MLELLFVVSGCSTSVDIVFIPGHAGEALQMGMSASFNSSAV